MSMTEIGALKIGLVVDGVAHKEFEMRLATMADVEDALETVGENACTARLNRHIWARTITRLGTLPEDKMKPEALAELLGRLDSSEYGQLAAAEASLRGKLGAASASSGSSGSSS